MEPRPRRTPSLTFMARVALCAALAACQSVTLDLTDLEEPVLLNGSLFVGPDPVFDHVGAFEGTIEHWQVTSSSSSQNGNTTTTTTTQQGAKTDNLQVNAYEQVGAKLHHAIVDCEIDVGAMSFNGLFAMGHQVDIDVIGKVVRYRFARPAAPALAAAHVPESEGH